MTDKSEVMSILNKVRAFWEARILMTAAEFDIFTLLADTPGTAVEVSKKISSNLKGTEALLNALVAIELLSKEDGVFRVMPGLEKTLSSTSPESALPVILHMAHMWDSWGKLKEVIEKGKEGVFFEPIMRGEDGIMAFIGAMHAIGGSMAHSVVEKLELEDHKSMIDVGGGSGVYTIAMLRAAPAMRATIFDLVPVVQIAKEKLTEATLVDRCTFVAGDYNNDPLPGGHDLALLSAVIHSNSANQNVALYKNVFNALVEGGKIVIRDFVMNDDHTAPLGGAVFAINMLVNTQGGGTYSYEEIKVHLESAGFTGVTLLHSGEMDSLVTAQKPAL